MRARTLDMYLEMFVFQTLIHLAYVPQVRHVNNNKGTKTIAPHPSDVTSVACPMVNFSQVEGFSKLESRQQSCKNIVQYWYILQLLRHFLWVYFEVVVHNFGQG